MFVVRPSLSLFPKTLKHTRKSVLLLKNRQLSNSLACYNQNSDSSPYIVKSKYEDVDIPDVTVPEMILGKLGKYEKLSGSKSIATECSVTGRKYTFTQIRQKIRNLGKSLRKNVKLNEGDVVALLLPNVPEFPIAILGALQVGVVVTTLNPLYTPEEISRQLVDSSAKAIITLNHHLYEVASKSAKLAKKHLPIIIVKTEASEALPENAIDFHELADNSQIDFPDVQISNETIALLPYSSGTTGLPKGVQLTHRNLVANILQGDGPENRFMEDTSVDFQEIIPSVLPMFHIYGMTIFCFFTLYKGAKSVSLPRFTPELYIDVLKKFSPTILYTAPPLFLFLSVHPEVKPEYLKSVQSVFCGAAPLTAQDEERFLRKLDRQVDIMQGYGLTETSPLVSVTPKTVKSASKVFGSIGNLVPNTLAKIIDLEDPTGTPLGPGCKGELLLKGPQVMRGYHGKPEETKNSFLDGWLRTGDMAYYNKDEFFFITDRLKELIKVKGFQVPPAELEGTIREFPQVEEAAVIGIPHESYGEVPRAYVVVKKGAKIDTDSLDRYVAEKVADYKRLQGGIVVVDSIPKNPSGKIMRRQLKMEYLGANK